MKKRLSNSMIGLLVIGIIVIIVVPMPPTLMSFLLIVNIAFSLTILLTSLYVKEPLGFSSFPTLLLIATLFRLSLNISLTRLILSNGGNAGKVIETFGQFVIGGNVVVGMIVFLIIIIIQFIVITKGAERVSEVTARFTLDSMPGKQMAIDADLNAGLINEEQAKARRKAVQDEADFYGSMDGSSKFVKGDAIAGIIITVINIVGGIIIGMMEGKMEINQVLEVYSLATVGDGLVSQIPALFISTATGIITTRAASENNLNVDVAKQLFSQASVMKIGGITLLLLNLVPGLPKLTMIIVGGSMLLLGMRLEKAKTQGEESPGTEIEARPPETQRVNIMDLLNVDPISLEFGYSLIPLVDEEQGGDLLDRMVMVRQQCASELGIIIPIVRFRDNLSLRPNEYSINIKGIEIERGQVLADHLLAMNAVDSEDIEGIETRDPAFGMPAKWITREARDRAEMLGYTVIAPSSVIITHLTEVIKKYSYELLGRQEVKQLLDNLKEKNPVLVEEVVPAVVSVGVVQKVLAGLLKEGLSIRNLPAILETVGDYGKLTKDPNLIIEYVRQSLRREITNKYAKNGKIDVITMAPEFEELITAGIRKTDNGNYLALEPDNIKKIMTRTREETEKAMKLGISPVILTSPAVRSYMKEISLKLSPNIDILSYNELENTVRIQVVGNI